MPRGTKPSPAAKAQILAAIRAGERDEDIAQRHGLHWKSVGRYRRAECPAAPKRAKIPSATVRRVRELRAAGKTWGHISEATGLEKGTCRKYVDGSVRQEPAAVPIPEGLRETHRIFPKEVEALAVWIQFAAALKGPDPRAAAKAARHAAQDALFDARLADAQARVARRS